MSGDTQAKIMVEFVIYEDIGGPFILSADQEELAVLVRLTREHTINNTPETFQALKAYMEYLDSSRRAADPEQTATIAMVA